MFFLKYIHACVCFIYIIIYTVHTPICTQKHLFWMRLIAINRLTALVYRYIFFIVYRFGYKMLSQTNIPDSHVVNKVP